MTRGRWVGITAATMLLLVGRSASGQETVDVTGTWELALEGAFAAQLWALDVGREGEALAATLTMDRMGEARLTDVRLAGDTLTGGFTADMHGQEVHVTVTTSWQDGCRGVITGLPMGTIPYTCQRSNRRPGDAPSSHPAVVLAS